MLLGMGWLVGSVPIAPRETVSLDAPAWSWTDLTSIISSPTWIVGCGEGFGVKGEGFGVWG